MGIEIKISKLNTRINKRCSTKAIRNGTMIFFRIKGAMITQEGKLHPASGGARPEI